MQTYSMLFLDIDGTLLNSGHQIPQNTKKLLQRLQRRGVPIVLCSARSPGGVEHVAVQGDIHGPIVCYSGGLILNQDRSIIREEGLSLPLAQRLEAWITETFPDVCTSAFLYDVWLVRDPSHPDIRAEMEITGCTPLQSSLQAVASPAAQVHKLLCIGAHQQLQALRARAQTRFPMLSFLFSKSTYLEIGAKSSSKAAALRLLRGYFGLAPADTVAFGDHFADVEMLREAGLGIAMGNAPEAVKKAADRVTASNEEEGVYIALKNLKFSAPV